MATKTISTPPIILQSTNLPKTGSSLLKKSLVPIPKLNSTKLPSTPMTRSVVQTLNEDFEIKDYQGIIAKSALENELLHSGYAPLSKIVIKDDHNHKKTQYIKALNKKGQKVFILVDVTGYTTARNTDLTLLESTKAQIVPYSLKTGAYNCAGNEVCGIAFECGSDSVCVLSRHGNDLTPKEANFVFMEQKDNKSNTIEGNIPTGRLEQNGQIMTYPIVRLSEIRANPEIVLANTDLVTRRLRNTTYRMLLDESAEICRSIDNLNESFKRFDILRENDACRLNRTLNQLDEWNDIYIAHPPTTDETKENYHKLQFNLAQRNEGMETLLRSMRKITDMKPHIDAMTKELNDVIDFCQKEFAMIDYVIPQ